jgi:hypothetical protein
MEARELLEKESQRVTAASDGRRFRFVGEG